MVSESDQLAVELFQGKHSISLYALLIYSVFVCEMKDETCYIGLHPMTYVNQLSQLVRSRAWCSRYLRPSTLFSPFPLYSIVLDLDGHGYLKCSNIVSSMMEIVPS